MPMHKSKWRVIKLSSSLIRIRDQMIIFLPFIRLIKKFEKKDKKAEGQR